VNAYDYGVPQLRERLFVVGFREDEKPANMFEFPPTLPLNQRVVLGNVLRNITTRDRHEGFAFGPERQRFLELIPQGGNWRDLPKDIKREYLGQRTKAKAVRLSRLDYNKPCNTILTQTEFCHPELNRPLTLRECARIQGFPDEWTFVGTINSKYKQVGNAAPVVLVEHIVRQVKSALE
jgi:DNA (cytosine-5)-methyltransferase 1